MDSEEQETNYCEDDGDYRTYCEIFDKLCIERYYKKHLKSQTHTNYIYKRLRFH